MGLRSYTDAELIARVESHAKGFDGWKVGIYDIWVRENDRTAANVDVFRDKCFTFEVKTEGKPQFVMVCTGTSMTGSWALKNYKSYNRDGAAILASDTFVRDSHYYATHKGYPAYKQGKDFPHYRDGDLDSIAEEQGELHHGVIAANCHRANEKQISTRNYNWSAGCMVRNDPNQFRAWLAFMGKRSLSVAILKEF
jgi:hypothetical protein